MPRLVGNHVCTDVHTVINRIVMMAGVQFFITKSKSNASMCTKPKLWHEFTLCYCSTASISCGLEQSLSIMLQARATFPVSVWTAES